MDQFSPLQPLRKPSLRRIIWTDYPASYASLVPVVSWIVLLAWLPDWRGDGPIISPIARPFFLALAAIATLAGLAVLVWRVWLVFKLFGKGLQVRGKISSVEIRRDHGWVEFCYIFDHKEYTSRTEVHRNAQTKGLKAGDLVVLVVDRANPQRAFIRDLYLAA
jgi:Protein of unknown function (DUF3592)